MIPVKERDVRPVQVVSFSNRKAFSFDAEIKISSNGQVIYGAVQDIVT